MSQAETIRSDKAASSQTFAVSPNELNRHGTVGRITEVMQTLNAESEQESRLNLDLGDVGWLSSAGLNELIGIRSNARSKGIRLVLVNVPKQVRDVFALTRLERMFEFGASDRPDVEIHLS